VASPQQEALVDLSTTTEGMAEESELVEMAEWVSKVQQQAAELGKDLPPNVEPYLRRAAELLGEAKDAYRLNEEASVGVQTPEERTVLARCSLQCAFRACELRCQQLPGRSGGKGNAAAKGAHQLMMFSEALRGMILKLDSAANWVPPPVIDSSSETPSSDEYKSKLDEKKRNQKKLAADRALYHMVDEDLFLASTPASSSQQQQQQRREDGPVAARGYTSTFDQFATFCGMALCRDPCKDNAANCCSSGGGTGGEDESRRRLDNVILPEGAKVAKEAASVDELPKGARGLLESTAKALLEAAETAARERRSRGKPQRKNNNNSNKSQKATAARQFQRAALHLEMLRLLGGRQLSPALETSRRYARWRARHLSHLRENVILEHGPEDPRTFEDVYEPSTSSSGKKQVLGRGGYGVVFACTRKVDRVKLACKQLDLSRLSAAGLAQLHEEVNAMRALDHPHICRLLEVFYSERRRCYLVMELCRGGELFTVLDKRCAAAGRPVRVFTERRTAELTRQMLGALRYMHAQGVAHRDVKMENWLFDVNDPDSSAHLKLVDFGLAKVFGGATTSQRDLRLPPSSSSGKPNFQPQKSFDEEEDGLLGGGDDEARTTEYFHERVGSAYYVAPEVLKGEYDRRCDLWSLGVIVYMLLCGAPPFWGSSDREILRRVRDHRLAFPDELWKGTSKMAIEFIRGLLERDVDRRFSADLALRHDFLKVEDSYFPLTAATLADVAESFRYTAERAGIMPAARSDQMDIDSDMTQPPTATSLESSSRRSSTSSLGETSSSETLADAFRRFSKLNALEKVTVELAASLMEPQRLVALRDDFLAADANADGTLSLAELRDYLAKETQHLQNSSEAKDSGISALSSEASLLANLQPGEVEELFAAADIDKTRSISYREFVAAALSRRVDIDDQALHAAFSAIDSEGLGYITKESCVATIGASRGLADEAAIDEALREADSDGDGKIDVNEFLDFLKHVSCVLYL